MADDAAAGASGSGTEEAVSSGSFVFGDGSTYEGEFTKKDGVIVRQGTGTFADGVESYEGGWRNDEMHGSGAYRAASGASYEGMFAGGEYDGDGTYTWPDGARYTGGWRGGLMHGNGTYRSSAGVTWAGTFYRGRYDTGKAFVDVREE